jgi:hypothetical protein
MTTAIEIAQRTSRDYEITEEAPILKKRDL